MTGTGRADFRDIGPVTKFFVWLAPALSDLRSWRRRFRVERSIVIAVIRQQLTDEGMNAFPVRGWADGDECRAIPHVSHALARYIACPSSETGDEDCGIFFGETLAVLRLWPPTKHTDAPPVAPLQTY
jgi:hypothetical protein